MKGRGKGGRSPAAQRRRAAQDIGSSDAAPNNKITKEAVSKHKVFVGTFSLRALYYTPDYLQETLGT